MRGSSDTIMKKHDWIVHIGSCHTIFNCTFCGTSRAIDADDKAEKQKIIERTDCDTMLARRVALRLLGVPKAPENVRRTR